MLDYFRRAKIGPTRTVIEVAHEANNEVSLITTVVSLLPEVIDDRPAALEMLDNLRCSAQRLQRPFDEVLHFARPMTLDRKLCDLRDVWRNAWKSLEWRWKRGDAVFDDDEASADTIGWVDSVRIEQVFRNLFQNSLEAIQDHVRKIGTCSRATSVVLKCELYRGRSHSASTFFFASPVIKLHGALLQSSSFAITRQRSIDRSRIDPGPH